MRRGVVDHRARRGRGVGVATESVGVGEPDTGTPDGEALGDADGTETRSLGSGTVEGELAVWPHAATATAMASDTSRTEIRCLNISTP